MEWINMVNPGLKILEGLCPGNKAYSPTSEPRMGSTILGWSSMFDVHIHHKIFGITLLKKRVPVSEAELSSLNILNLLVIILLF